MNASLFIPRLVAHHAMSEGEVAQGGLASQEKDGGVGPAEQGVPGIGVWSYLLQSQAGDISDRGEDDLCWTTPGQTLWVVADGEEEEGDE